MTTDPRGGRTTRCLLALALGLCAGAALNLAHDEALTNFAVALKPLGNLWLAGLQMTLAPMIFALVTVGAADWSRRGGGRVISFALALFTGLALTAALASGFLMTLALRAWPPMAHVGGGVVAGAPPPAPPLADQLVALVPTNPVAAAAQGQFAALVVFALVLGLALGRIGARERDAVTDVLNGVARAMTVIVEWVLTAAPVGIFVLALGVALTGGAAVAGVVAQAIVLTSALVAVALVACYLVAWIGGGVSPIAFARAAAGPQAVAAGTTSSMATLPAMIEAAQAKLGMSRQNAGTILPLAVSVFRIGNVTLITGSAIFAAHAAGLTPTAAQIVVVAAVVVVTNFGTVGLPAAAVMWATEAPAFQAAGAPLDLLPLLIATAALPDVLDTACNVTGHMAVSTVVARFADRQPAPEGAVAEPA